MHQIYSYRACLFTKKYKELRIYYGKKYRDFITFCKTNPKSMIGLLFTILRLVLLKVIKDQKKETLLTVYDFCLLLFICTLYFVKKVTSSQAILVTGTRDIIIVTCLKPRNANC